VRSGVGVIPSPSLQCGVSQEIVGDIDVLFGWDGVGRSVVAGGVDGVVNHVILHRIRLKLTIPEPKSKTMLELRSLHRLILEVVNETCGDPIGF